MTRSLGLPLVALGVGLLLAPTLARAAGPVQRGDPNDDAQVPGLNEAQLNRNYRGPWYYPNGTENPTPAPPPGTVMVMPAPAGGQTVPPRY